MIARAFPLPSPVSSPQPISYDSSRRRRRFPEATASAPAEEPRAPASRSRANLVALRKEKVRLPEYTDVHGRAFSISEFLNHPSGVESLLNTRALQSFESLGPNTYRCTLHKICFLAFEVAPVLELRVIPTIVDCTVEMLACKFEGSESVERQNNLFSAFMRNHITWVVDCSDPCLEVDVNLSVSLEMKYYVVFIGRRPGVYNTWEECHKNVVMYSGALFRKVNSKEEACSLLQAYLEQHQNQLPSTSQQNNNTRRILCFVLCLILLLLSVKYILW